MMGIKSILVYFSDRAAGILGAFLGSQVPAFMQQYTQQLAGRVNELKQIVDQLQLLADKTHLPLDQYIDKLQKSNDTVLINHAHFMNDIVVRWQDLYSSYLQLNQSHGLDHILYFIKHVDTSIARSTFSVFQPGLSFSLEGGLFLVIGYFAAVGLLHACLWLLTPKKNQVLN